MLVKNILDEITRPLAKLGEDARLVDAAKRLHGPDASLVVVCSGDGRIAGVVGKTDVVDRISHCSGASCGMPVSSVMARDVVCCRPETPLSEVWATMTSPSDRSATATCLLLVDGAGGERLGSRTEGNSGRPAGLDGVFWDARPRLPPNGGVSAQHLGNGGPLRQHCQFIDRLRL